MIKPVNHRRQGSPLGLVIFHNTCTLMATSFILGMDLIILTPFKDRQFVEGLRGGSLDSLLTQGQIFVVVVVEMELFEQMFSHLCLWFFSIEARDKFTLKNSDYDHV